MFYRYLFCLGFSSTQFIALERNVKLCSSLMYCTNKVNLLLKYIYCAINQMFDICNHIKLPNSNWFS